MPGTIRPPEKSGGRVSLLSIGLKRWFSVSGSRSIYVSIPANFMAYVAVKDRHIKLNSPILALATYPAYAAAFEMLILATVYATHDDMQSRYRKEGEDQRSCSERFLSHAVHFRFIGDTNELSAYFLGLAISLGLGVFAAMMTAFAMRQVPNKQCDARETERALLPFAFSYFAASGLIRAVVGGFVMAFVDFGSRGRLGNVPECIQSDSRYVPRLYALQERLQE